MNLESLGKKIGAFASVTGKKAESQIYIAKLSLDKVGLEKQVEGIQMAIGRYCYNEMKKGEVLPSEIQAYCVDIDLLKKEISDLEDQAAQHKGERDSATYNEDSIIVTEVYDAEPLLLEAEKEE